MSYRRFFHLSLVSFYLLVAFSVAYGQSVTFQGETKTVKGLAVSEPFARVPAQANVPGPVIEQPGFEQFSEPKVPALAIPGGTAAVTAQAQSLTSPGAVLGQVFDVPGDGSFTPDSGVAAGPNHLVYMMNAHIAVYNKVGGSLQTNSFFTFFQSISNGAFIFDPRAVYDPKHDRFILIAVGTLNNQESHIFIAVSETGDPTGNWFKYALDTHVPSPEGTLTFTDFPSLGLSSTELYLSASQVPNGPGTETAYVWVLQLADLLSGAATLRVTTFPHVKLPNGGNAFTIQPAVMYGDQGVAYMASADATPSVGGNSIHLFSIPTTGTPTLTVTDIPVAAYKPVASAPQPSATRLSNEGDILVSSPVWRNGSLWVTHAVADSTGQFPLVRWYEIVTATHSVRQSGTISGAGAAFMPSITVTATGATDIVFFTSSSTQFVSAAFAHREASQPLGQMPVQAIYQQGLSAYTGDGGRWGDYTAISADPGGSSSWTLAEYPLSQTTYSLSSAHLLSSPSSTACSTSVVGVKICAPASGATVTSPVRISAAAKGNHTIVAMKAYANGKQIASSSNGGLSASVALSKITYTLVVNAWDSAGVLYQKSEKFTVH
jgi:Bacterial Ig domain